MCVRSLSEFMEYVEELDPAFCMSRGQSRNYPLLPSALRRDERGNRKYSRQTICHFLNEFKIHSHNYMPNPWDIRNDYEWMIYAQHYGIPTKLLDFSLSHIVSLLFAVENSLNEREENNAVIWFLDPCKLNLASARRAEMITLDGNANNYLDEYDGPIAVQGRKLNIRINAQNGVFVYFQDASDPLETINNTEILKRLDISAESRKRIMVSLNSMGFGFAQIYPELTSVSKDILLRNSIRNYMQEGGQENG